jgi:hypothetical protein
MALYEQYWTPTTDAPREYLVACALVTTGTVLSHRVFLPFGGDRIYPNLWVVLLGPSSTFRKTTTVKQVRRTLGRLTEGDPHGMLFPDEFSKEALIARLSERAQGLLTYSEFSGALAAMSRDYMSGTKELLADLYDSPPKYQRTVGNRTATAQNVCIGILAASQTDWLLEKLKETDIRGGFMARMLFVPAFYKRRFLALPPEPDTQVGNKLIQRLRQHQQLEDAMAMPPSVRDRYAAWLEAHERELDSLPRAGQLGPFWSRMGIITLKVAMIVTVTTTGQLVMTDEAIESAITFTAFTKRALGRLFDEEMAFTPDMRNRQKVLQTIRRHPGIAFRDVLRNCGLLKRNLDPVVETLIAEGLVVLDPKTKSYSIVGESASVGTGSTDTNRPVFVRVK